MGDEIIFIILGGCLIIILLFIFFILGIIYEEHDLEKIEDYLREKDEKRIVGTQTHLSSLSNYRKYLYGEMSEEEYAKSDGRSIVRDIYSDGTFGPERRE